MQLNAVSYLKTLLETGVTSVAPPIIGRVITITNAGATLTDSTLTLTFTDTGAISGVTRYSVWQGANELSSYSVAPSTSVLVTDIPSTGQPITLTLKPPGGYVDDNFTPVEAIFTTASGGVAFASPLANSTALSSSVLFTWGGGPVGAVYDLIVYPTDEDRQAGTNKMIGSDGNPMDTNGLGTKTSHTFTNDLEDGGNRYVKLYQWWPATYDDTELTTIDLDYTASGAASIMLTPSSGIFTNVSRTFSISGLPVGYTWGVKAGPTNDSSTYDDSGTLGTASSILLTGFPSDGSAIVVTLTTQNGTDPIQKTYYNFTAYTLYPDPSANELFVAVNGDNSYPGDSAVFPKKTIQAAVDLGGPDITVWVKAGNYGDQRISAIKSGTALAPFKIKGYTNTPGDSPSDAGFNHNSAVNSLLMPVLDHNNRTGPDATGLIVTGDYVEVSGFYITNFTHGAKIDSGSNKAVLSDIYIKDVGDYSHSTGGYNGVGCKANGSNFQMLRVIVVNATGEGLSFGVGSSDGLIQYSKAYCNEGREPVGGDQGTDYYCIISGSRHLFQHCYLERVYDLGHGGHGYRFQAAVDCIVEDSIGKHLKNGTFTTKELPGRGNIFRRCTAEGSGVGGAPPQSTFTSGGNGLGIHMLDSGDGVTFEDIVMNDVQYGIAYNQPVTDSTFRRITMNGITNSAFSFSGTGTTTNTVYDVINVNNAGYLYKFWGSNTASSSCVLTNSTFTGIVNKYNGGNSEDNQITIGSGNSINSPHTLP